MSIFDAYLPHYGTLIRTGTPNAADNGQTRTGDARTATRCRWQPSSALIRQRDGSFERSVAIVYLPSDTLNVDAMDAFEYQGTSYRILALDRCLAPSGAVLAIELTVG